MILVIGLGNPGKNYQPTRHNVGFMMVDALGKMLRRSFIAKKAWPVQLAEARIGGQKLLLVKPQSYMNLSGQAIKPIADYYKIEPKKIWVISDDLDLPLGTVRLRAGSGSGGHRGLDSINQHLGSEDYVHIRVGIGPALAISGQSDEIRRPEAEIYVLEPFTPREKPILDEAIAITVAYMLDALERGMMENHTLLVKDGFSQ